VTNIKTTDRTLSCGTFNRMCFCDDEIISIWLDNRDITSSSFRFNTIFIF
jgi:hypothetical protein